MKIRILQLFVLLLLLPAAATGQENKDHNFDVAKNMQLFNEIYGYLDLMYVDTLNADEVMGTAINSMLRSLDPYTVYYPEDKVKELRTMMTGRYVGIGAVIRQNMKLRRVVIDEPYAGNPAAEVGLKKGDIILSIDDSTMTDKDVSYVSSRLRGDAGTTFVLKIKRPSTGKVMDFKITRRSVAMPTIPFYGLGKDGIGYLSLSSFTEGCSDDVRRAFVEMKHKGMKGFILDLRGNGGGSLSEAVNIVNMFVPKGLTLVYWEYFVPDAETCGHMIDMHRQISDNVKYAGTFFRWHGIAPANAFSEKVMKRALTACKNREVKDVLFALWADYGGGASIFSVLPAMYEMSRFAANDCKEEQTDHRRFELAQARNMADASIAQVQKTLKDLGDKVESADRAACENAIKDVEERIKGEDKAAIEKSVEALMAAAQKIGEKLNQQATQTQQAQAGAQQQAGGAGQQQANKGDDDVVDADYTEVKH